MYAAWPKVSSNSRPTSSSDSNTLSSPQPPGNRPRYDSHPHAQGAADSPEAKAFPAVALAVRRAVPAVSGILVALGVDDTPSGSTGGRDHGHDTPVRAKVFDAPDDGNDDGNERESTAVAEANEGGGYMRKLRVRDE